MSVKVTESFLCNAVLEAIPQIVSSFPRYDISCKPDGEHKYVVTHSGRNDGIITFEVTPEADGRVIGLKIATLKPNDFTIPKMFALANKLEKLLGDTATIELG